MQSGSADALRLVKDKIKTDFLVLSCDLIVEIPSHIILDAYRAVHSAVIALFYEHDGGELRANRDDTSDYVGIDAKRSRLLMLTSKDDVDQRINVSLNILKKFPVLDIHTKLRDAHLYVFKKWVLELVVQKKNISSIKEDLMPLLVKYQSNPRHGPLKEIMEKRKFASNQRWIADSTRSRDSIISAFNERFSRLDLFSSICKVAGRLSPI